MKLRNKEHEPEVLRDTSHLSAGTKRLSLAAICGLALLLGFISGAIVWLVLRIMSLGIDALWTWLPDTLGLGHSLPYHLIVCLVGGLIIGLAQRQVGPLPDNMEQVMGKIKLQGGYPYDRLHIIAICALLPLIFGGALGPEAGLTGLAAGLCCWVGDRLKCKGDQVVALAETGFAATLGIIFHAPLFGIAMDLEPDDPTEHYRAKIVSKKTRIVIYCFGVAGGMLAFGLLGKFLGGGSGLPRFNAEHAIGLDQWIWFLPLLALGLLFSLYYQAMERITGKLGARLMGRAAGGSEHDATAGGAGRVAAKSWRPVIAALIPAVCMAVCGWAVPLTMFSGEHQLEDLIQGWSIWSEGNAQILTADGAASLSGAPAIASLLGGAPAFSVAALILTAILKLLLVSICINFGWRGGSIFPIIFSGACVGYAFALIVGMDGAFAAAILISSLYAYQMRKPVAVIMVLLLCFPITYIVPVGITAFAAAKIPSPFAPKGDLHG